MGLILLWEEFFHGFMSQHKKQQHPLSLFPFSVFGTSFVSPVCLSVSLCVCVGESVCVCVCVCVRARV